MSKEKSKKINWEPNIDKGTDLAKKIRESNEKLKEDWGHTKQKGYNKP